MFSQNQFQAGLTLTQNLHQSIDASFSIMAPALIKQVQKNIDLCIKNGNTTWETARNPCGDYYSFAYEGYDTIGPDKPCYITMPNGDNVNIANDEPRTSCKILIFATQTNTFMFVLWHGGMHIREVSSWLKTCDASDREIYLKGCTDKFRNGASEYFRYHDGRDKGYVCSFAKNLIHGLPRDDKEFVTTAFTAVDTTRNLGVLDLLFDMFLGEKRYTHNFVEDNEVK